MTRLKDDKKGFYIVLTCVLMRERNVLFNDALNTF